MSLRGVTFSDSATLGSFWGHFWGRPLLFPHSSVSVKTACRLGLEVSNDDGLWHHYETAWHNIDAKVLSAIYLFAKKMPLLFTAPLTSIGKIARKRKRDNTTML